MVLPRMEPSLEVVIYKYSYFIYYDIGFFLHISFHNNIITISIVLILRNDDGLQEVTVEI